MKTLLALILMLSVATALVACGDDDDDTDTTLTPTTSAEETETPAPSVENVCGVNPDPATDAELLVTAPEEGDELTSPVTISGEAPLFDGRVWFRAYSDPETVIIDHGGSTNFGHLDEPFDEEVEFSVSEDTVACLEVYLLRPTEGGVTDMVQIPVLLMADDDTTPVSTVSPGEVTDVCPENPDPATEEEVVITEPPSGGSVVSPIVAAGSAAAFEAAIQLTLLDGDGNMLADQPGMTEEGQTLAPFEETIEFTVDAETDACLQVYMLSAENGEPINIAQIPLVLLPPSE